MSDKTELNKPFGMLLREMIAKSSLSAKDFEKKMSQRLLEMPEKERVNFEGAAPQVAVVSLMVDIIRPSPDDEKALFRAAAPLVAADETKPFAELVAVCRRAVGLTLEEAGKKLNQKVKNNRYDPAIRIALFEMNALFPTQKEAKAMAEIFAIPKKEHSIFTSKVSATRQKGLKLVDASFISEARPTQEDIETAEEIVEKEERRRQEFAADAGAGTLKSPKKKIDKGRKE